MVVVVAAVLMIVAAVLIAVGGRSKRLAIRSGRRTVQNLDIQERRAVPPEEREPERQVHLGTPAGGDPAKVEHNAHAPTPCSPAAP